MSTYQPGDRTPISSVAQLAHIFAPQAPTPGRVGIEWELLPIGPAGKLAPYLGPDGIESALGRLGPGHRFIKDSGHIAAVSLSGGGMVGLEPGGQVEIATPPLSTIEELEAFLRETLLALDRATAGSGFGLAPWGVAPMNGEEDLPDVPKARYGILRSHLLKAGKLGRRMMKLTASTQISLDYRDEAELTSMVRTALTALPYVLAYTANGPIYQGRRTRWATQRPKIWRETDRRRCGLPAFLFRPVVTYEAAARWALGCPALFVVRGGEFVPSDGRNFSQLVSSPGPFGTMTMEDWDLHISTLFPDLRLRGYLEVRSLDSLPLPLVLAVTAFFKGALSERGRRVMGAVAWPPLTRADVARSLLLAGRLGPRWVPAKGPAPRPAMEALLAAARAGLHSLGETPERLDPLQDLVLGDRCPADSWFRLPGGAWMGPSDG